MDIKKSKGNNISRCLYNDLQIIGFYLNIYKYPNVICNPLRCDKKPSLGLQYYKDKVFLKDFSTNKTYRVINFIQNLLNLNTYQDAVNRINEDLYNNFTEVQYNLHINKNNIYSSKKGSSRYSIRITKRQWLEHDIDYWNSYGVNLDMLKYCNVIPLEYYYLYDGEPTQQNLLYTFKANKWAYAYREVLENRIMYKIYQPYSQKYKWTSSFNSNVISLINKIPKQGDILCICSSVKDSLCLWCNLNIPAICPQGEGYALPQELISNLKERYKQIYIFYDNDKAGIEDAEKASQQTGLPYIVLPEINHCKDISDLYKSLNNKTEFINTIRKLFNHD